MLPSNSDVDFFWKYIKSWRLEGEEGHCYGFFFIFTIISDSNYFEIRLTCLHFLINCYFHDMIGNLLSFNFFFRKRCSYLDQAGKKRRKSPAGFEKSEHLFAKLKYSKTIIVLSWDFISYNSTIKIDTDLNCIIGYLNY